jgi:hypothetical protein
MRVGTITAKRKKILKNWCSTLQVKKVESFAEEHDIQIVF